MKRGVPKIIVAAAIGILVGVFFAYDLHHYLTLSYLKSHQLAFDRYYSAHRVPAIVIYMAAYIVMAALSLPGATVMTLAAGALFGLWTGLVMVSLASTIGATLAFLASRFLFRETVQNKFGDKLTTVNEGIRREGAFYLFTLRLVPAFPFFLINLAMGLTPIRTWVFYIVSQVGMLPGTIVYVNAGTVLGDIESVDGILSAELLFAFALLGLFPLIARRFVAILKARKAFKGHQRPRKYDYNLVVVGAGSAGLVSAYIAATVRAKVALIERERMGGDCLNTGCVPSKALIRSAKVLSYVRRAKEFGFDGGAIEFDFARVMERVQRVIDKVAPHDSIERYTRLGVDCITGQARIRSPFAVEVGGRILTTRAIVLATGARPFVPPIPGIDRVRCLTSDNVWDLRRLPERLVVLGGGPIGCELSQAFARLGSQVTQIEMFPRILSREDEDISAMIQKGFEAEGIRVLTGHRALEIVVNGKSKRLVCDHAGERVEVEFDEILVAVGRVPNTSGFGLEELGIEISSKGTLEADSFLRTNFPNIFCAGDVAGPYQFTHTAAHQAWYASINALFGGFKTFKADYRVIPWATYTDPEVARVGINEKEARERGIAYEAATYRIDDLDRAIADSEDHGMVRVLTVPGKDRILGVTIVGAHASDIIAEYILAMRQRIGLNKIFGTIHIYPTLAEANKFAAGEWKKAHAPETLLRWLARFHRWRRR